MHTPTCVSSACVHNVHGVQEHRSAFTGGVSTRRILIGACLGISVLLTGCASNFSATVTQFQAWPANTLDATYRVVPKGQEVNNLEFQTVADMLSVSLGEIGLVPATNPSNARFNVYADYGSSVSQTMVPTYPGPYMDGWGMGSYYGMWGGPMFAPSVEMPVQVYKNRLTVTINDMQDNSREVYRSTVSSVSNNENLIQAMPYLVRAAFDNFPGNNGQVREVTIPVAAN